MAKVRKINDRYVLDYSIDGVRTKERQPKGTRKADAERKLRKILDSIDDGTYAAHNMYYRYYLPAQKKVKVPKKRKRRCSQQVATVYSLLIVASLKG